jgi:hypothetical protein
MYLNSLKTAAVQGSMLHWQGQLQCRHGQLLAAGFSAQVVTCFAYGQ